MKDRDVNDMTDEEKREAGISWINQLDEFALDEVLVDFCGLSDRENVALQIGTPSPPKLRPMSELPEVNSFGVCLTHESLNNTFAWVNMTFESPKRYLIGFPNYDNCMSLFEAGKGEYKSESYTAIGWLPLPNPNEIEL